MVVGRGFGAGEGVVGAGVDGPGGGTLKEC